MAVLRATGRVVRRSSSRPDAWCGGPSRDSSWPSKFPGPVHTPDTRPGRVHRDRRCPSRVERRSLPWPHESSSARSGRCRPGPVGAAAARRRPARARPTCPTLGRGSRPAGRCPRRRRSTRPPPADGRPGLQRAGVAPFGRPARRTAGRARRARAGRRRRARPRRALAVVAAGDPRGAWEWRPRLRDHRCNCRPRSRGAPSAGQRAASRTGRVRRVGTSVTDSGAGPSARARHGSGDGAGGRGAGGR